MGGPNSLVWMLILASILSFIPPVFSVCTQNHDCHNGGACVHNRCQCPVGFVGDTCDERVEYALGGYYEAYWYTTWVITLLFFFACCAKLGRMYYINRKFTMKHLTIILITIAMFLRTIAYGSGLDGNWNRAYKLDLLWGFTFFPFYSLTVSAYLCELFIWIELYTATTLHKIETLPTLKKVFFVINGILFPNEIVTRIVLSVLKNTPTASLIFAIWMVYMGLVCIVETVGFFIMAGLLLRKMFRLQAISGHKEGRRTFIRVSILMISTASFLLLGLGIVIWFFFASDLWTWYALLWFARVVEFLFVACLLVTVKTPQPTGSRVASIQTGKNWSEEHNTINVSKNNSKVDESTIEAEEDEDEMEEVDTS